MPNVGGLELVFLALIAMIWVVVPVTIVLLVRANRTRNIRPTSDPALDALRVRLANGEIDDREYERLRTLLQGH
jgi:uncharacterized membrane protein